MYKVLNEEEPIATLNDYAKLRAEEIPLEEVNMTENQKRVHIAHFHRDFSLGT